MHVLIDECCSALFPFLAGSTRILFDVHISNAVFGRVHACFTMLALIIGGGSY
jgi:hypothetical protein